MTEQAVSVQEPRKPNNAEISLFRVIGKSNGKIAKSVSDAGLDVFTPFKGVQGPKSRRVELVGRGEELLDNHDVVQLHVLSTKLERTAGNTRNPRIDFQTFGVAQENWGGWWSVPMIEYESEEAMQKAYDKFTAENGGKYAGMLTSLTRLEDIAKQCSMDKKFPYAREAMITAKALEKLKVMRVNENKVPPELVDEQPFRFNFERTLILNVSSGQKDDPTAWWTNVGMQTNQAAQTTGMNSETNDHADDA